MMKSEQHNLNRVKAQRINRVRAKVKGTAERPRLAVFRSLKHINAQLIDDVAGKTIVAVQDTEVDKKLKGVAKAEAVGTMLAEKAKGKNVSAAIFDRRWYKYHGQVKALAEAARAGGLTL